MSRFFSLERFEQPAFLWLALVVVLLWLFSRRSLAGLGPVRSRLAMAARGVVIVLLVLALAGTHKILENDDLNVMFLFDFSRSVPAEVRREAEQFVVDVCRKGMKPDDRAALLTFDGQANIEQLPARPGADGGVHVPLPLPDGRRPDKTNIAQGIRIATACALEDTNNRVLIISDGNQNVGDARAEAQTAKANNISVDVLPVRYERGADVVFDQLRAPPYANLHERISLRMMLRSSARTSGRIVLFRRVGMEEAPLDLDPADAGEIGARVTLEAGQNALTYPLPIEAQRSHEFRAEFIPDNPNADVLNENNVAVAFTTVEGPQEVLFIGSPKDREDDQMLIDALEREEIRVSWAAADGVDLRPTTLQDYAAIVLANVGADNFSSEQQRALATYERELGGGLIMLGGDDSFGAGGWQGSPVEEVLPVKCEVDAVRQIPKGALAIVMHSCEMPDGNKWGVETAVAALKTLSSLDYFGVVSAGMGMGGHHWEVKMQPASNKDAIVQRLRNMQNADMFDFQTPMSMAYTALLNCRDASQRHMIIISDGDPAAPSTGLLNKMVGNKITCSTVGIFPHTGFEISTLKNIAKKAGGSYYFLNKPGDEKQLPKIFIKEAKIVRRPLVRDEIFTPKINPNHLSEIMRNIDAPLPDLMGYVVTTPRKVADVEVPLLTKRGDPLLAHWLCGLGRSVAFTSGRWKHWGADWPEWAGFSKLWAQTVRWCMQQGSAANYDVTTTVEGDECHVVIEGMEDVASVANFRPQGRVMRPTGEAVGLEIVQTGPTRFETRFPVAEKGAHLVSVLAPGAPGEKPIMIRTGVTVSYSPEFKDREANEALLVELANETGGRPLGFGTAAETVFAHNLPPVTSRTPIWETLLKLAIIAFLLDVAVRRVAIDPIKMLATTRGYIATLAGRFGAGKRAEKTLTDLRGIRERVRSEKTRAGDGGALQPTGAPAGPVEDGPMLDAGKKFDAGAAAARPSQEIVDAMSGVEAGERREATPKPAAKKDQPQESTTARLLKAKKRARDQQDQNE